MNEEAKELKLKAIISQRVAGFLMMHGCALVKMERSNRNPDLNVFFFLETSKLIGLLTDYTNHQNRNKTENQKHEETIYHRDNRSGL